jgi:hypothetical protein
LVKAGYLQQAQSGLAQVTETVFSLTRQGWILFPPQERRWLQIGLPLPYERMQQFLTQEAYLRLAADAQTTGAILVAWRSEHELRSEQRYWWQNPTAGRWSSTDEIPDGQAVLCAADGSLEYVDIEIDGQYFGRMLRQKAEYYGQRGCPTIWVCRAARVPIVQRATQMYPNIRVLVV